MINENQKSFAGFFDTLTIFLLLFFLARATHHETFKQGTKRL